MRRCSLHIECRFLPTKIRQAYRGHVSGDIFPPCRFVVPADDDLEGYVSRTERRTSWT